MDSNKVVKQVDDWPYKFKLRARSTWRLDCQLVSRSICALLNHSTVAKQPANVQVSRKQQFVRKKKNQLTNIRYGIVLIDHINLLFRRVAWTWFELKLHNSLIISYSFFVVVKWTFNYHLIRGGDQDCVFKLSSTWGKLYSN